jgi:2-polyprenyl-3-methyl-5-hydroxy-6-metoxy-1,4-benzoquinol methylase
MVLHHVEDTAKLINLLHSSLEPGGYLAVADLDEEDGSFHDNPVGVPHHGFNRDNLKILFERTGFTHVRSILAHSIRKERKGKIRDYPVFLMVGQSRV